MNASISLQHDTTHSELFFFFKGSGLRLNCKKNKNQEFVLTFIELSIFLSSDV